MDPTEHISRRAYEIWEAEGRPHGRHHEHWLQAEQELGLETPEPSGTGDAGGVDPIGIADRTSATDPHPGMMGDGTEEQNLDQPGNPDARITEDEVEEAFGSAAEQ